MTDKTCDKCQHFTAHIFYVDAGICALTGDANNFRCNFLTKKLGIDQARAYGFDFEGHQAGVMVGPKFGCVHWSAKIPTT